MTVAAASGGTNRSADLRSADGARLHIPSTHAWHGPRRCRRGHRPGDDEVGRGKS